MAVPSRLLSGIWILWRMGVRECDGCGDDTGRIAGCRPNPVLQPVSQVHVASSHQAGRDAQQEPGAGSGPVPEPLVVGAIPREPKGFLQRPDTVATPGADDAGTPVVRVVTGMAGVGKTQLAAGHAHAMLTAGWRLVAWVNAENSETLLSGLAAVADAVGLSDGGAGRDAVDPGPLLRQWLEADGDRCLLVFEDADDRETLQPFLPAIGAAHVLITSARASMADLGTAVPVDVFTAGQARAFLAERTGLADDEAAAEVAAELGHLPLALAHAAAVITWQDLGYRTYLEQLRALRAGKYPPPEPVQPYPDGVAEAVLLSLEAAGSSGQSGVCARVTQMLAVLSAAGVQRPLLHLGGQAGTLADGGRRLTRAQVDQALEVLADWSLLTFGLDGQTVIMHPLVSRVVRDRLARRARLTAVARAVASVLEVRARALAGSRDRPAVRDVTVQAAALLGNVPAPEVGQHQELSSVLLRLRFLTLYHLIELGDSAPQAVAVGESLTADLERIGGPDHPDTMNARNSLAAAYQAAGQTAQAMGLFEQILVGRQRLLGPDHLSTLTSQNNLAAAYQDAGQTGEAILLFKMTLAARERILGPDHLSTLTSMGNLAAAYRDAGRAADAIPLLERTLAGRERILGPDHPDTMSSRNNLAAAYRDAGRAADAIPLLEQILAGTERQLGPDDPRTLRLLSKMAAAYREAGRAAAAVPLARRVLTTREQLLGPEHPSTVAAMNNLALTYRDAGRITEAIPLLELTVAACEQMLVEDHPRTRAARNNLAAAYRVAGRAG